MVKVPAAAVADAIALWLNNQQTAGAWPVVNDANGNPQSWNAARSWDPVEVLEEMAATIFVEVVPDNVDSATIQTRGTKQQDFHGWILIRQRYIVPGAAPDSSIPNSFVDGLANLVEAIGSAVVDLILTGLPTGYNMWCAAAPVNSCHAAYLRNFRTFAGEIEVTMRQIRPRAD